MKKFLSIILLIAMLLTAVSCTKADGLSNNELGGNNSPDATIDNTTTDNNSPRHYEIELNLDNYVTYLSQNQESGAWCGVLRFAYYENVIFTYDVLVEHEVYDYTLQKYVVDTTYRGDYNLVLNAAGEGNFKWNRSVLDAIQCPYDTPIDRSGWNRTATLKAVSGKVLFSV